MTLRLSGPAGARCDRVADMLRQICPKATLQVDDDGALIIGARALCPDEDLHSHRHGCACIRDLISAARTVTIVVADDLSSVGGGRTDDASPDDTVNGVGSDETVTIDVRNRYRQRRKDTGAWISVPAWIILAHELCGHALPGVRGDHPEWRVGRPGFTPDWHRQSEQVEDAIRSEHGLAPRGTSQSVKRR